MGLQLSECMDYFPEQSDIAGNTAHFIRKVSAFSPEKEFSS